MITAFVQFKLPQAITKEIGREIFLSTAPKYREVPGLIRKYYLLSMDGSTVGGVYLWKSLQEAEALYNNEWRKFVQGKYGSEPLVTYFECPVIVDNLTGEIIKDD